MRSQFYRSLGEYLDQDLDLDLGPLINSEDFHFMTLWRDEQCAPAEERRSGCRNLDLDSHLI